MALEDCLLKALNAGLIKPQQADQIRKLEKAEDSEIRFLESFIQEKVEVKRKANLQVIATQRNIRHP